MLLILFWFVDGVTDTWQLISIVQMLLRIINLKNLISENKINSQSAHFLTQFLFHEKVSWSLYILAVRTFFEVWNQENNRHIINTFQQLQQINEANHIVFAPLRPFSIAQLFFGYFIRAWVPSQCARIVFFHRWYVDTSYDILGWYFW